MIEQDTQVTADVILLSTSDNNNLAFIETAELDGETNLKVRTALQATSDLMPSNVDDFGDEVLKMAAFDGKVECEPPNNILDKFTGTLILRNPADKKQMRYPISNENVLLRQGDNIGSRAYWQELKSETLTLSLIKRHYPAQCELGVWFGRICRP